MSESDFEALRQRLFKKMMRLRDRERAEGWTYDAMVPPGWREPE